LQTVKTSYYNTYFNELQHKIQLLISSFFFCEMKRKELISSSTRAKKRQKITEKSEKHQNNQINSKSEKNNSLDSKLWQNFPFVNFPLEIQLHIISQLDLSSQERFRTVSKYWNTIVNSSNDFWSARYYRDFGGPKHDLTFRDAYEKADKEAREILKHLPKNTRKRRTYDSFQKRSDSRSTVNNK